MNPSVECDPPLLDVNQDRFDDGFLARFFPTHPTTQLAFCYLVPFAALIFQFLFIAFQPLSWGLFPLFPLAAATVLTLVWKKWGFLGGVALLAISTGYLALQFSLGMWAALFFLGETSTLAVLFLCQEEVGHSFEEIELRDKKRVKEYHALAEDHLAELLALKKTEESLLEELRDWKEEAEQRAIDYRGLLEKVEIMQKDMVFFQSQKDALMEQAFAGQQVVETHREKLESVSQMEHALKEQLSTLESDKAHYKVQIEHLEGKNNTLVDELELERKKVNSLEIALQNKKSAPPILSKMITLLIHSLASITKEEADRSLKQECAKWQGLYKQLREQFEEKNQVLHTTRTELFKQQEKYESAVIESEQLRSDEQAAAYKQLSEICLALEKELEEQKAALIETEALVSHILHV